MGKKRKPKRFATAIYRREKLAGLPVTKLRIPHFPALVHSFVCGTAPNGELWLLDRNRVAVTVNAVEMPLAEFLSNGGNLENIK